LVGGLLKKYGSSRAVSPLSFLLYVAQAMQRQSDLQLIGCNAEHGTLAQG